jgi:hypothetical protein
MGVYWVLAALVGAARCNAETVSENEAWAVIQANKGNETALHTIYAPPWVSAAEFRGTMAILQTCVLTLFACIYTALHLNVPPKADFLSVFVMKTKWVLMALFAPEIVLYMAADQLIQAVRLKRVLREMQKDSDKVDKNVSNLPY